MINQESKLIFALMQIDNLIKLLEGNEYEKFCLSHLISVDVELKRQLTNIQHHSKIKE